MKIKICKISYYVVLIKNYTAGRNECYNLKHMQWEILL